MRFEIFKRDNFTCQYCGRTPPTIILVIDHVCPVSNGGGNEDLNLITSCEDCNSGKSDKQLTEVQPALKEQIKRKREQTYQIQAFNDMLMEIRSRETETITRIGVYWYDLTIDSKPGKFIFGQGRSPSIRTFLKHLPEAELLEAIDIAFAKYPTHRENDSRTFRYFCGICWRKIREANP